MKTSFYFVLWIVIYPVLGLFNFPMLNENAFIIALIIVIGLSWALNKMMPEILIYQQASDAFPVCEGFLYGSLAIYFGIKDFLTILPRLHRHKTLQP
ncbi:MAG: hypothetical protein K2K64_08660 [Muribaculaceae bacterium]|nr:hypothetical protein [Muribaculaceae bacterium]